MPKDTVIGCPGERTNPMGEICRCAWHTTKTIEEKPFNRASGYDPQMKKVKCFLCGLEYYLAPAPTYRRVSWKQS